MTDNKRNHPTRRRPDLEGTPTPEMIKAARLAADLPPGAAGAVVLHTAEQWLAWESGARRMHPIIWWAFQQRVNNQK